MKFHTALTHFICTLVLLLVAAPASAQLTPTTPWTEGTAYPGEISDHSCVTSGGYVYCVGGQAVVGNPPFKANRFDLAFFAPLTPTGVGAWTQTTSYAKGFFADRFPYDAEMTIDIRGHKCVASGGYIYCVAGFRGVAGDKPDGNQKPRPAPTARVFYAPLSSSGIGQWNITADYVVPEPPDAILPDWLKDVLVSHRTVANHSCTADQGTIICVGGTEEFTLPDIPGIPTSSVPIPVPFVQTAALTPEGIGEWTLGTSYGAGGVAEQSCVAYRGFVYCIGGFLNRTWLEFIDPFIEADTNEVWFAPFTSTGVGTWRRTTDYAGGPVRRHDCQVVTGHAVCVGGADDEVWSAALSADGVGTWVQMLSYPALDHWDLGSCISDGGRLTCVGGHDFTKLGDIGSIAPVYSASFSAAYDIRDAASCGAAVNGTWEAGRSVCSMTSNQTLSATTTLTVPNGTTLTILSGSSLINLGTLRCDGVCEVAGGAAANYGTLRVTGTLRNVGGSLWNHSGVIDNAGVIANADHFGNSATIVNAGQIVNDRWFTNKGSVGNVGGTGRLRNNASGSINNTGLIIASADEVENLGTVFTVLSATTCRRDATISPLSPFVVPGSWNAGTCTAGFLSNFAQPLALPTRFTFHIPPGITLINRGSFELGGTLNNMGTLINEGMFVDGAYRNGTGLLRVRGRVVNRAGALFTHRTSGSVSILDGGAIVNAGRFESLSGSGIAVGPGSALENQATMTIASSSSVIVYGSITNTGTILNQGHITTSSTLGSIVNNAGGTIVNELAGTTNGLTGTLSNNIGLTTVFLNSTSCSTLGGTWTSSSHRCVISSGSPTIIPSMILKVEASTTLESLVQLHVDGGLVVAGALVNHDILFVDAGLLRIDQGGSFLNFGELRTTQQPSIVNNAGTLTNATAGTVNNHGTFENSGAVMNFGSIQNLANMHNAGSVTNTCGGLFSNWPAAGFTGEAVVAGACDMPSPLEPLTLTLASSPSPSAIGQAVTLTATLSDPGAVGTVTFYRGAVSIGDGLVTAGDTAALVTTALAAGVNTLTAKYNGDALHAQGTSAPLMHPVTATGSRPASVAVGDFNGDSRDDLAVVNEGSNTVTVMAGDGAGGFAASASYAVGQNPIGIAMADLNSDGTPDLVVANYDSHTVSVLLGIGDGAFHPAVHVSAGFRAVAVAVADFNTDGHADLAVANNIFDQVTLLRGNGDGTFQAAGAVTVGDAPLSLAVGDFNEDGHSDLVVGNDISRSLSLLSGRGDGTFQPAVTMPNFNSPAAIAVTDVDGDGHRDLVVVNYDGYNTGTSVQILPGHGNGTFKPARNHRTGVDATAVALGDFNGDGIEDLAVSNQLSDTVSFLYGYGSAGLGVFAPPVDVGVGRGPRFVAAGDFNGDGVSDFVTANTLGDDITVRLSPNTAPDLTVTQMLIGSIRHAALGASYVIEVENVGQGATNGPVTIIMTLPVGMTAASIDGNGWMCVLGTLTCERSDVLDAGGRYPAITLTVSVAADAGAILVVSTAVSGGGQLNTGNDSVSAPTTVLPKAELTVLVADQSRLFGSANPVLTGTIVGIENNDHVTATYATTAVTSSAAGTYPITATLAASAGVLDQYNVTIVPGALTVTMPSVTPIPVIDHLEPNSVVKRDPALDSSNFVLHIHGAGFVPQSVVRWNGVQVGKTFLGNDHLAVTVPAATLSETGVRYITVFNPVTNGGGGSSAIKELFITDSPTAVLAATTATASGGAVTVSAGVTPDSVAVQTVGAGPATVTVAQYAANPGGTVTFAGAGSFFDIFVGPWTGSAIATLTGTICAPGANRVYWFYGSTWQLASAQSYDAIAGCVVVTVTDETSPTLDELDGTYFATAGDIPGPALTLPSDITMEAADHNGAVVTYNASANDLVDGGVAIHCAPASGSTFALGATTVQCTATNSALKTATASFVVTVNDTAVPSIFAPAAVTVEATSASGATIADAIIGSPVASDTVSAVTISRVPAGNQFPLGPTTILWMAADASSNTVTASQAVLVRDTTAPVISGVPANMTAAATSAAGVILSYAAPSASDLVDGDVAVSCAPAAGSTFPVGPTAVSCSAADAQANPASASFTVTVTPYVAPKPPTINLRNTTAEATGPAGAVVTVKATANDKIDGPLIPVCAPGSGSLFPLGQTSVTCTATNSMGASVSASAVVTVRDTKAPKVDKLPNQRVEAAEPSGAIATYIASATDLVDGSVPVTCAPASGSLFPLGKTTVTCSAADLSGNIGNDAFVVNVVDTTNPTIVSVTPSVTVLPNTNEVVPVSIAALATDLVDAAPVCQIIRVGGGGQDLNSDGVIDWTITGPLTLNVEAVARARRDRTYTITVRCTDASGNASKEKTAVVVSRQ